VASAGRASSEEAQRGRRSSLHNSRSESGNNGTEGDPQLAVGVSISSPLLFVADMDKIVSEMTNFYKDHLTKPPTRPELVTLAVHSLGGDLRVVDTEDVAVRVNELAPGVFSWRKYPQQVNLELVRVALSDAKKPQNGSLLLGSGRQGWRLSSAGVDWITSERGRRLRGNDELVEESRTSTAGSIDTVRKEAARAWLVSTEAWRKWCGGEQVDIREARRAFRAEGFTSLAQIEVKAARLRSLLDGDAKIVQFVAEMRNLLLRG